MPNEMSTFYLINRNGRNVAIELLHYVNNKYAAERAMMSAYGLSKSDIQLESGGNPIWARTNACSTFDGRNAH